MKIFQRVILLGLFVAAGVGIALGLGFLVDGGFSIDGGFSTDVSNKSAGKELCSSRNANAPAKSNAGEKSAALPASDGLSSAVIVLPNPLFANQATPSAAAEEPAGGDASRPAADTSSQKNTQTQSAAGPTGSLNIGDLSSQSGVDSLLQKALQQAAKLVGQADSNNNNTSQKRKQSTALPEQIPAGTVPDRQPVPRDRIDRLKVIEVNGNERLSINIQNADIREVLDLLGQQGNLNILTSSQVQGSVSATLSDVDLNSALDAILKSAGLTARREGSFIFVGTNQDFQSMERSMDRVSTRVYRPNYVQAAELEALIVPVLTQGIPGVGVVSVTTPSEIGIQSDDTTAGGDTYAGTDAVVVRDFEAVLAEIDQLVAEIDVRPTQVQIEAMILSVELSDEFKFGVSFEVLRQFPHLRFGWGTPESTLNNFKYDGGVKVAFLDDTLGAFVDALETVGDTDVIGTPRLLVVNKHRAEIQVGESRGYVSTTQTETARTQSVEFLELGILLRIRPFISSDGIIRMEVHPEISDGDVDVKEGFTLPNKQVTQVTTNVMVHDGCTVVIGGLLKEELNIDRTQIPLLGSLPVIGVLFRTKTEVMKRRELIILLTPHIVKEPGTCDEGSEAAGEFHRRHEVVREKTSPLGKRSLGRRYTRKAQQAWAMGDRDRAMRLAEMAVNFDPQNRKAIDLRGNIWMGRRVGKHTLPPESDDQSQQHPLDGRQVAPWILDDLGALHPIDPGQPGRGVDITRPQKLEPLASPR